MRFVLLAALSLCLASLCCASEASQAAKAGRKAERKDQVSQAYLQYSRAAALKPKNRKYRAKVAALETRAAIASKVEAPMLPGPGFDDVMAEPEQYFDSLTARDFAGMRQPLPPPELHARPGRQDIDLQGNFKFVWAETA